jgi:hypothetical protein
VIMSGPYGMQHLKNQCCSNCKRKKLEDRVVRMLASSQANFLWNKLSSSMAQEFFVEPSQEVLW